MHDHDARLANLLGATGLHVADAELAAVEDRLGLGGGAAAALVTLGARAGWSAEQLRGGLRLSQPGAARLFERLVRAGYVERRQALGRTRPLGLTPAGERVVDELLEARRTALEGLLAPLGAADREALSGLLE